MATSFSVASPICVPTSSQWRNIGIKTHGSFAPADGWLCMVNNKTWQFSAATDDVFTVAGGHGMTSYNVTNHSLIVFLAPYGETLPGGITAGQIYYIDTVPNSTTFTVSATPGGAKLDITGAGTGWGFEQIGDLCRVYWDNVRFDLIVADVNGLFANLQQPAYITNLRIEMAAAATVRAYGAFLSGQIVYVTNVEINPHVNCTCMLLSGTGMYVDGFNCNGQASGSVGIEAQAFASTVRNLWTETVGIGVRIPTGVRGFTIDGTWLVANSTVALQVEDLDAAYEVGIIKGDTSGYTILNDTAHGITLVGTNGTPAQSIVSDYQGTYMGHIQSARNDADLDWGAVVFKKRNTTHVNAAYQIRLIDETVLVDCNGSDRTVTLPAAGGWRGHRHTIAHYGDPAHQVTVACYGAQTIQGVSTYVIPVSGSVTVVSDGGSNWIVVAKGS